MSVLDTRTQSSWAAVTDEPLSTSTVGGLLQAAAVAEPDRAALVDGVPDTAARRTWTYAALLADAERTARALLGRFRPGERVAVWSPNCPEYVLLQFGAALAGITLVTVNPAYRARELAYVLEHSGASGLCHVRSFRGLDTAEIVAEARRGATALREVIVLDEWDTFLAGGDGSRPLPDIDPLSPAMLQYTSGTTGFPKGVLTHHRGLVNSARLVARRAGVETGCVWVNPMPMFHVGSCGTVTLGTMSLFGTHVLLPGFDPAVELELLETHRGTVTLAVPTMLIAMLDSPDLARRDVGALRTVLTGGSLVPAALVRRVRDTFGCRFTITFGQTETSGPATQTDPDGSLAEQVETVGRALPHTEAKIVDPATGATLPVGEEGEICTRGPMTMIGYLDAGAGTGVEPGSIDPDGWLHYGDLGTMDAGGYLRVTGRLKDVIVRGGENISPREIEDVLFAHPSVADVAVVGAPDDRWGEKVVAVVRHPAGDPPTPHALHAWCRERLAAHKTPVEWYLVEEFPLTASGKVQKFRLREMIRDGGLARLDATGQDAR